MKKIKVVSNARRRHIRRMIRENFLEQRLLKEKRELALQEFKIAHERKLQETGSIGEANLLLLEVDIMSALGFGSISGLKQQFVTSVMKDMGMSTDTLAGKFMVNVIENIGMKQLFALMGSGDSCDAVVELLSKAAMETITEYGAAKLIAYVFEKTAGKTNFIRKEKRTVVKVKTKTNKPTKETFLLFFIKVNIILNPLFYCEQKPG